MSCWCCAERPATKVVNTAASGNSAEAVDLCGRLVQNRTCSFRQGEEAIGPCVHCELAVEVLAYRTKGMRKYPIGLCVPSYRRCRTIINHPPRYESYCRTPVDCCCAAHDAHLQPIVCGGCTNPCDKYNHPSLHLPNPYRRRYTNRSHSASSTSSIPAKASL
ncbi:hypothetical protein PMIN01_12873 [Paraphaeosphaeria minitans]|uniref:Uncharacterized protein n=1 Tax=Paraphaeosphaeria minitans TaxID=565426 RepID=A0A9P6G5Q2_9PLEO|nr:hypothetical protein PMIN01_12873 [Paraphaeosphaeria minitans]